MLVVDIPRMIAFALPGYEALPSTVLHFCAFSLYKSIYNARGRPCLTLCFTATGLK